MLNEYREELITREEYHKWSKKLERKLEAIDAAGTSMPDSSDDDSDDEEAMFSSSLSVL